MSTTIELKLSNSISEKLKISKSWAPKFGLTWHHFIQCYSPCFTRIFNIKAPRSVDVFIKFFL